MTSKRNMFTKPAWTTPPDNSPEVSDFKSVRESKIESSVKVFNRAPVDEQYGAEYKLTEEDHKAARDNDYEITHKLPRCTIL